MYNKNQAPAVRKVYRKHLQKKKRKIAQTTVEGYFLINILRVAEKSPAVIV